MLRVLVIDEARARAAELCAGLALAGHQVAAVLPSALDLAERVESIRPDVVLIETDSPSRDTLEHLAAINRELPRPVVLLTHERDAEVMREAFRAGVSAYVVDDLDLARLKPIVDVAVARFELLHQAKYEPLAKVIAKDVAKVSPDTEVRRVLYDVRDPWDLEAMYGVLHDFARQ